MPQPADLTVPGALVFVVDLLRNRGIGERAFGFGR